MPALLLSLSAAPAAAPQPRMAAGNAASVADFGAALGEATSVCGAPGLPPGAFVAPPVAKGEASIKGGQGGRDHRGIGTREDAKVKRPAEQAAALPQTVPPALVAPAAKSDAEASAPTVQDPGPATLPLPSADGSAVSQDAAAGPGPQPHAASPAHDVPGDKPVAAVVKDDPVQQPGSASAMTSGDALPDDAGGDDAPGSTEDEAAPAVAAQSQASLKLRTPAHEDTVPGTHGAGPAVDPGAAAGVPAPVRAETGGGDPQQAAGALAAAPAGAAPAASETRPPAAAAPPAPAPAPPPAAQLGQAVAALHVGAGSSGHVSIRLDPEALGAVRIDVRRGEEGIAAVTLTVERAQTLHALQTDLSHLHRALDRAGVPAEQRSISLHLAAPEDRAGGRDAAAGGGGQSGQQGATQQRAPQPTRFVAGGGQAGWQPGVPGAPPRVLRAGFDITA